MIVENKNGPLSDRLLLRATETSQMLGISARKLWSMTAGGEIPCLRMGKSVRYNLESLRRWIAQREKGGGRE